MGGLNVPRGPGAQPNINAAEYASMAIPLPPLPEQQEIADVLDGIEGALERVRVQTDVLRLLKAGVAEALLTGKVRVVGMSQSKGDTK